MTEPRRKTKPRKTTSGWKVLGGIGYILFLGICMGFGAVGGWLSQSDVVKEIGKQKMLGTKPEKIFGDSIDGGKSLTVLVMGCDKELYYRGKQVLKQYARSDMMMVVRLDFERNVVGAVSIPRDTLCKVPGYDRQKINGYNAKGGPDLAKAAVEELLPVKIDRVVILNFDAFEDIINLVGGVDVYVPRDMKYTDKAANLYIDLKKGRQHLDGYDAMCFVRWRKNSNGRGGDSDFERQKRQKDLMLEVKKKLLENWDKTPKVLDKTVEISGKAFDSEETVALALFMQSLGSDEKIRMGQIPVVEIPGTYDLSVDGDKLPAVLKQYLITPSDEIPALDGEKS